MKQPLFYKTESGRWDDRRTTRSSRPPRTQTYNVSIENEEVRNLPATIATNNSRLGRAAEDWVLG